MKYATPLLALVGITALAGVCICYDEMSPAEQEHADRLAARYADEVFRKTLDALTNSQAREVDRLTRRHFYN